MYSYPIEFILFQEATTQLFDTGLLLDYINNYSNNLDSINSDKFGSGNAFVSIFYNKNIFINPIIILNYDLDNGRPCLSVIFEDTRTTPHSKIIVTNVHFPHKKDTGELFDKVMENVIQQNISFNDSISDRYIIGGDFNGVPNFTNTIFKQYKSLPKTCCFSGGHGESDIIYDTSQPLSELKLIDIDNFRAPEYNIGRKNPNLENEYYYGSDHLPVSLSNYNILTGGYNLKKSKRKKSKRNNSKRKKSKRKKSKRNKSKRKSNK